MIRLVNISDQPLEVYNPFLDPLLDGFNHALVLSLATPEGVKMGDFLHNSVSSLGGPTADHWLTIPPGGTTLTPRTFRAGQFSPFAFSGPGTLPPGKYQLQVRAHDHVISGRPSGIDRASLEMMPARAKQKLGARLTEALLQLPPDDPARTTYSDWLSAFPGPEICRSNRVELEILPRTGD